MARTNPTIPTSVSSGARAGSGSSPPSLEGGSGTAGGGVDARAVAGAGGVRRKVSTAWLSLQEALRQAAAHRRTWSLPIAVLAQWPAPAGRCTGPGLFCAVPADCGVTP